MKIVRFAIDEKTQYGILKDDSIQVIEGNPYPSIQPVSLYYHLDAVRLLAPCAPSKIVALGLNYHQHAKELNSPLPNAPLIFLKPSTAVIGPEASITYPAISHRVDYEGELGVVIKKPVWRVPVEEALDYVLGYTCFNDVTARDLQFQDNQWTRAKSFDTFAAVGPYVETELNPADLTVETRLNGNIKQRGNTRDLIYSIPELINFISHVMTLLPGDIIATGTPSGVGPMQHGDTVEITIEPIGTLKNYVAGEDREVPRPTHVRKW
ncbi:MAG: fumarylacetoacetate hydrolase family protein [Chloroflexota bacterium]